MQLLQRWIRPAPTKWQAKWQDRAQCWDRSGASVQHLPRAPAGISLRPAIPQLTCSRRSAAESPPATCTGAWACSRRGQGEAQRGRGGACAAGVCRDCALQSVDLAEYRAELCCPAGPASPQAVPRLEAAPRVGALAVPVRSKGNCCFMQLVGPWLAKVPGSRAMPSCCQVQSAADSLINVVSAWVGLKPWPPPSMVDGKGTPISHVLVTHATSANQSAQPGQLAQPS